MLRFVVRRLVTFIPGQNTQGNAVIASSNRFSAPGLASAGISVQNDSVMNSNTFFGYWFTFTPPDRGAGGGV